MAIIIVAAFLHNTSPPDDRCATPEEIVPLTYWPGKPRDRKNAVVVRMGARRLVRATASMMCDPHVQLLAPLVFYTGTSLGFLVNDFAVVSNLPSAT